MKVRNEGKRCEYIEEDGLCDVMVWYGMAWHGMDGMFNVYVYDGYACDLDGDAGSVCICTCPHMMMRSGWVGAVARRVRLMGSRETKAHVLLRSSTFDLTTTSSVKCLNYPPELSGFLTSRGFCRLVVNFGILP